MNLNTFRAATRGNDNKFDNKQNSSRTNLKKYTILGRL